MSSGRPQPRLAIAGLLLSVLWLGLALWQLVQPRLLSPGETGAVSSTTPVTVTAVDIPAPSPAPALPGLHLFGVAPPKLAPKTQTKAVATVDRVPLEVLGTLPGPKADQGFAIVLGPEGQATYAVGEALPGGALLKLVDTRGALIEWNGATERVELPRPSMTSADAPVVSPALAQQAQQAQTKAKAKPNPQQRAIQQKLQQQRLQQQKQRQPMR